MGSDDISNQVWALQVPIDNDALHLHLDANTFVTVYKFSSKTPGVVIVKRSEADDLPRDTAPFSCHYTKFQVFDADDEEEPALV